MSRTFGYYMTISLKDLISSIMINEDRTVIGKDELYDTYLKTTYEMKQRGIQGRIAYSRDDLKEFKFEYENEFEVGINYIKLCDGLSLEWVEEHIASYMSVDKMQVLGLIPYDDEYSY